MNKRRRWSWTELVLRDTLHSLTETCILFFWERGWNKVDLVPVLLNSLFWNKLYRHQFISQVLDVALTISDRHCFLGLVLTYFHRNQIVKKEKFAVNCCRRVIDLYVLFIINLIIRICVNFAVAQFYFLFTLRVRLSRVRLNMISGNLVYPSQLVPKSTRT